MVIRIVTGGQTGADRAAMDAALDAGVSIGGWVPAGRLAEDGIIPARYASLVEAPSADPAIRTSLNVRDSNATLIVSRGALSGGSYFTLAEASRLGRPLLHIDLAQRPVSDAATAIREWLRALDDCVLNVAGPRASEDPEIGRLVYTLVRDVLGGT